MAKNIKPIPITLNKKKMYNFIILITYGLFITVRSDFFIKVVIIYLRTPDFILFKMVYRGATDVLRSATQLAENETRERGACAGIGRMSRLIAPPSAACAARIYSQGHTSGAPVRTRRLHAQHNTLYSRVPSLSAIYVARTNVTLILHLSALTILSQKKNINKKHVNNICQFEVVVGTMVCVELLCDADVDAAAGVVRMCCSGTENSGPSNGSPETAAGTLGTASCGLPALPGRATPDLPAPCPALRHAVLGETWQSTDRGTLRLQAHS